MPLPIDLDKDVAIGISLPIEGGNRGYFRQTFTTLDQVSHNVINLLLTIPGERYMHPTFGSRIYEYLFEQFDDEVEDNISESITEALQEWLPYVNIESLSVTDGQDEQNPDSDLTIRVSLTISIESDPQSHMEIKFRGEGGGKVVVESITPQGDSYLPPTTESDKETYNSLKG